MTGVKMSGLIVRASPPVKLPSKMGMKTRPSKRASPLSRAGSLHIKTALRSMIYTALVCTNVNTVWKITAMNLLALLNEFTLDYHLQMSKGIRQVEFLQIVSFSFQ